MVHSAACREFKNLNGRVHECRQGRHGALKCTTQTDAYVNLFVTFLHLNIKPAVATSVITFLLFHKNTLKNKMLFLFFKFYLAFI